MRFRQEFLSMYITPVPTLFCFFITRSRLIHFFGQKIKKFRQECIWNTSASSTADVYQHHAHGLTRLTTPVSISNKVPQAWLHSIFRLRILSLGAAVYAWSKHYAYRQTTVTQPVIIEFDSSDDDSVTDDEFWALTMQCKTHPVPWMPCDDVLIICMWTCSVYWPVFVSRSSNLCSVIVNILYFTVYMLKSRKKKTTARKQRNIW